MDYFSKDVIERFVWTFIQGALATGSIEAMLTGNVDALQAAYIGGGAAVLSLVKSLAAKKVGDPQTAGTIPEGQPHTEPGPTHD